MAYSAADALASAMYDSMFDWLVGRVNFAVQVKIYVLSDWCQRRNLVWLISRCRLVGGYTCIVLL